jgi:uncharacterized phage protein (TIGR02220 family)
MAKQPTLPLYYNDIARTCSTWTDEEFGCYMRLLMEQWDKGSIPNDPQRLSRLVTSFDKNWEMIKVKFVEADGVLKNHRMEEVREKQKMFAERNHKNGAKGGRPKKTQTITQKKPKNNPTHIPEKSPRVENENTIYCKYIEGVNSLLGKKFKGSADVEKKLMARIKEGRTLEEILLAVKNASKDSYHIEQEYKYLTPEFFTRADKLDKFSQQTGIKPTTDSGLYKPFVPIDYTKYASEE